MDEERVPMNVQDKKTETGITLNNILSFLLFAVMTWVGVNIEKIKEQMATANTVNGVQTVEIQALDARLDKVERELTQLRRYPDGS